MIVSWKDEDGATHWGDDTSKAYKKHLQAQAAAKPAEAKSVEAKPVVEVEAKRK
ncbi:hypothetical protein [Nocardia cyriacigeorgica]|uniref:hypothetical protein n=1 Tax=Nocardia cyriacigeorgica TaxID=135487 RepID=UPI001486B192|nr:hypothetical protein [Nocardia cyriacigeorgica]